jgi:Malectin domain/Right handed beta helix region
VKAPLRRFPGPWCRRLRLASRFSLVISVALATLLLPTAAVPQGHAATSVMRIDVGSSRTSTDASGQNWLADTGFVGGNVEDYGNVLTAGAIDPRVAQTARWGMSGYSVPLDGGWYRVDLLMAEHYFTAAGKRVFAASVEGTSLGSIDIFAQSGGAHRLLVKSASVNVTDGQLTIAFTRQVDEPEIIGLQIAPTSRPMGIDVGSSRTSTDASGQNWLADTGFVGGNVEDYGNVLTAGAIDPRVAQTARWGMTGYRVPLDSGWYQVDLLMAEHYFAAAGKRVFSASVEGTSLGSIDIFAQSGGAHRLLVKSATVNVSDGQLTITFTRQVDEPEIIGLQIMPVGAASEPLAPQPSPTASPIPTASPAPTPSPSPTPPPSPTPSPSPTPPPSPLPVLPANCTQRLQQLVDAAVAGSTLRVPACIFRESVIIPKPLTLDGQGAAHLRGSDVFDAWTRSGAVWISSRSVPSFAPDPAGAAYVDRFRATNPEQVFIDGAEQVQVPSNPQPGQFAMDGSRHVVLGNDPAGRLVEVTVRTQWLLPTADDVTVTGFVMKHAATHGQGWAIGNNDRLRFTLSASQLSDAHGGMISVGGGDTYARIANNLITRAGNLGIGGYRDGHAAIVGNTITGNGFGGWDWEWQAGGLKTAASTNQLVDRNVVFGNNGAGLWCDIGCRDVTYSNNRVYDHAASGILFEISTGAHIFGNAVWRSGLLGFPAISASSSGDADIHDNTVYDSPRGIQAYLDQRPDARPVTNVFIHENTIIMTLDRGYSMMIGDFGSGVTSAPTSNNTGRNNNVWFTTAENGGARFGWANRSYSSLVDFWQTPLGQGARYLSATERDAALASAGIDR